VAGHIWLAANSALGLERRSTVSQRAAARLMHPAFIESRPGLVANRLTLPAAARLARLLDTDFGLDRDGRRWVRRGAKMESAGPSKRTGPEMRQLKHVSTLDQLLAPPNLDLERAVREHGHCYKHSGRNRRRAADLFTNPKRQAAQPAGP